MWGVVCVTVFVSCVRSQVIPGKSRTNDGDYNTVNTDGSFDFGYANKDRGSSYHLAHGNANKVVGGRFGATDPATNTIKETIYTAGPRGFRAKGPNVHRKMDLDQRPRGPIGNKDDPYFDPNEDPSYSYRFDTRTYTKNENADARGDVKGHYSFVDDVGERHEVSYIAGRDTGFLVQTAVPDQPTLIGSPFHRSALVRGEKKPRGRTAVQRGLDGSYRFISAGPDQRRSESSDSHGNVRGSYTFLDDKGVQRTVNYIAGPGIGYRIVKSNKDPYIPGYFPTVPSPFDPDFANAAGPAPSFSPDDRGTDDVFKGPDGTAASGHVKPPPFLTDKDRPGKKPSPSSGTSSEENTSGESGYSPGPGSPSFGPESAENTFGPNSGGPSFGSGSSPTGFGPGSSGTSFGSGSSSPNFGAGLSGSNSPSFGQETSGPGPSFGQSPSGPSFEPGSGGSSVEDGSSSPSFGSGSSSPSLGSGPNSPSFGSGSSSPSFGSGSSGPSFGSGSSSPSFGSGSSSPSFGSGSTGPGFGSGSSSPAFGSGSSNPSFGSGSNVPSFGSGSSSPGFGQAPGGSSFENIGDSNIYDEEVFGGPKPTKGPGKPGTIKPGRPRPTSKPYRPVKKPYVPLKPFQTTNDKDDDFDAESDDKNRPQFAIGFNIHEKPGVTTIYKPVTTIIRNVGQDYFGVPPGVSVRAHVQSIDLYPFDSKPLSPSEALEKDKT